MRSFYSLLLILIFILSSLTSDVWAYLAQKISPLVLDIAGQNGAAVVVKHGDTLQIRWALIPGIQFPLYGYASAKTSKTEVGLLPVKSTRTQDYTYTIDTDVSVRDFAYTWTVSRDVPKGKYRLGIGFFYHETSNSEIHIV
ncbi:hypothetical protein [Parasitella parasitica]|uniref:Uncharacterized protein n=1 Tax=Parasitella parasitica TaxID=35722 RepID=A0A0B7N5P9_9FUNG|nr:hypothetical protein [Parasitella parasitica]